MGVVSCSASSCASEPAVGSTDVPRAALRPRLGDVGAAVEVSCTERCRRRRGVSTFSGAGPGSGKPPGMLGSVEASQEASAFSATWRLIRLGKPLRLLGRGPCVGVGSVFISAAAGSAAAARRPSGTPTGSGSGSGARSSTCVPPSASAAGSSMGPASTPSATCSLRAACSAVSSSLGAGHVSASAGASGSSPIGSGIGSSSRSASCRSSASSDVFAPGAPQRGSSARCVLRPAQLLRSGALRCQPANGLLFRSAGDDRTGCSSRSDGAGDGARCEKDGPRTALRSRRASGEPRVEPLSDELMGVRTRFSSPAGAAEGTRLSCVSGAGASASSMGSSSSAGSGSSRRSCAWSASRCTAGSTAQTPSRSVLRRIRRCAASAASRPRATLACVCSCCAVRRSSAIAST